MLGRAWIVFVVATSVAALDGDYKVSTVFNLRNHSANVHTLVAHPRGLFLLGLDSSGSRVYRFDLPISAGSSLEVFAGSPVGKAGYADGLATEALFDHPQSIVMDADGEQVFVADSRNYAIRKISKGLVTTIAGGKSPKPGYADGPGEHARFSADVSLAYSCGWLLISDRGNGVLRQVQVDSSKPCSSKKFVVPGTLLAVMASLVVVVGLFWLGYSVRSKLLNLLPRSLFQAQTQPLLSDLISLEDGESSHS